MSFFPSRTDGGGAPHASARYQAVSYGTVLDLPYRPFSKYGVEFLEIEWWLYFCTGKNVGVRDDTPDPLQYDDDDVCCVGPLLQHNSTSYGVVLVSYNSFIHSESHSLIGGV